MIKAVIFDFYGVVCSEIGSPWYKQLSSPELISELKEKYDKPSNLGEISEEDFFEGIGKAVDSSGERVKKEWVDAAVINLDLVRIITELKTRYKVALCSNSQPDLLRKLLKENDIEKLFDVVVSSSEVSMIKPDPKIFEYTLKELGMNAEEAVFIDDRKVNVEGARAAGIKSFVYLNNDKLKIELENYLLPNTL